MLSLIAGDKSQRVCRSRFATRDVTGVGKDGSNGERKRKREDDERGVGGGRVRDSRGDRAVETTRR